MGLPRWKRTGGRDFVFYHSHPGFEWDDLEVTTAYQDTICNDFQVRPIGPQRECFSTCIGNGATASSQQKMHCSTQSYCC